MTPRDYLKLGFSLLPVFSTNGKICACWKGADCPTPGKHPIPFNGVKDASTNVVDIQRWTDRNPGCNWAVACGTPLRGGGYLVCLDTDPRNGGDENLAALESEHGDLPETPMAITGGSGTHHLFRSREPVVSFDLAEGIEVKGANSYVLVSPSLHKSGKQYEWDLGRGLDLEIADLPDWIRTQRVQARPSASGDASTSFLGRVLEHLGLLLRPHKDGAWIVSCPWDDTHSSKSSPSATVLLPPVSGNNMGQFICKHAHCNKKHGNDVLNWAPPDAVAYARSHFQPKIIHTESPEEEPEERPLVGKFVGDEFRVEPNTANAVDIMGQWNAVAWDEMRQETMLVATPGHTPVVGALPRPWTDDDDTAVSVWLQRHPAYTAKWTANVVAEAVQHVAKKNSYNRIKTWLRSLAWDGIPRLDTWLVRYLDAADTPYARSVGSWWLLSAVARVMQPGCKVDHMLVLEGKQGKGKSTALSILGGDYFSDDLGDISDSKAAAERICGKWIVEDAELNSLKKASSSAAKSFITRTSDNYRKAYGRRAEATMRTCVFAGTINDSEYLPDMTGNRRYWPVKIYGLDKQALIDDRDQLFAEALFRYERGDKWWPEDMEFHAMAEIQQESRLLRDPWEAQVEALGFDECTITDVYSHLSLPSGQRTQENRRRIVNVLQRLGFTQRGRDHFSR